MSCRPHPNPIRLIGNQAVFRGFELRAVLARGLLVSAAMRKHFGSSQLVVAIWVVNIVSAWAIAAHALLGSA